MSVVSNPVVLAGLAAIGLKSLSERSKPSKPPDPLSEEMMDAAREQVLREQGATTEEIEESGLARVGGDQVREVVEDPTAPDRVVSIDHQRTFVMSGRQHGRSMTIEFEGGLDSKTKDDPGMLEKIQLVSNPAGAKVVDNDAEAAAYFTGRGPAEVTNTSSTGELTVTDQDTGKAYTIQPRSTRTI
jgi:hypothetical protein